MNTSRPLGSSANAAIHDLAGLCLAAALITSLACESIVSRSCEGPARPIDYWTSLPNDVDRANRIVVNGGNTGTEVLETIIDPDRIRIAAAFLRDHRDGWRENWNAGGGAVYLNFFRDDHLLGGYALTPLDTPADKRSRTCAISVGAVIKRIDASEVEALAERLGLRWPPKR